MARKNLVSASITDEAMTAVKKGLGDIATALPFLIVLSAEERRRTRVMGHKSVEFVNLALNGAESFSEYLLSSFNKAEMAKDIELINKLWKIRVDVASLLEKIDDTIYGASADAIKASSGALYNIPVYRTDDLSATVAFVKESGLTIAALTEKAKNLYTEADYNSPVALVLGAEDRGISSELLRLCDTQVKIPIVGRIESLNVSVAAGVVIYEVVRQRGSRYATHFSRNIE